MSGEKIKTMAEDQCFARYLSRDLHGRNILAHKVDAGRKKRKGRKEGKR